MRGELFNTVKLKKPRTNGFNMSYQLLTTGNMGDLIPIFCKEVVPGDVWRGRSEIFCRLMPMLRPVMQRIDIYTHYFFVPNRLLWNISKQRDSWQAFITGGEDGRQTPVPPKFTMTKANMYSVWDEFPNAFDTCSLWDYFGLPVFTERTLDEWFNSSSQEGSNESVLLYPFLAYQLIYDEYYRDANYTEPILDSENMQGGEYPYEKVAHLLKLRKRSWKKDYFTSSLKEAQRGAPVEFALGGEADVVWRGARTPDLFGEFIFDGSFSTFAGQSSNSNHFYLGGVDGDDGWGNVKEGRAWGPNPENDGSGPYVRMEGYNPNGTLYADMSGVSAINVQVLREGLRLQEWLERNNVGGARYVEQIYAHFGVMVPDATIQRPIYLGGGKQTIRISEVLQAVDDENAPLGDMAGHGVSVGRTHGFNNRKFTEHGYIIGIMSVIPTASYMNGLDRSWCRFDKLDYYFPEFAHLGEQEVKIKELVFALENYVIDGELGPENGTRNDDTFGYQSRYAEYKYSEDKITGEFRTTLRDWHLGRYFNTQFDNNADFLEVQPQETERIFAVQDNGATSKLLFQIYHDFQAIRPMPKYATPYI